MRLRAMIAAALLAPPALAAPAPITEAALRRHIAILADDAMEGRKPGTPGGERAERYIAETMAQAGLSPGAAGGGWYQPVSLVERVPREARLMVEASDMGTVVDPKEMVLTGGEEAARIAGARLLFAGYGLDLDDADLTGAVVLMLRGQPPRARDAPGFEERRAAILQRGAAALILIGGEGRAWEAIRAQLAAGRTRLEGAPHATIEGAISAAGWARLAADAAALMAAAARPDFRVRPLNETVTVEATTTVRRYQSANVIGRIDGSRGGEAVLLLAHWDHLGICRAEDAPDPICNGAVDNASGVAVLLEVARSLTAGERPQRNLIFVATTAEEMGLLGARAFVQAPPVPLPSIVAALNLDTVAIAPAGQPVAVIGRGLTPLDPLVDATARALGRRVDRDRQADAFLARQDGWELLQAGVPAIMAGGAFSDPAHLGRFLAHPYHRPEDELAHIQLAGAAEDAVFHVALARALADPARWRSPRPAPISPPLDSPTARQ